MRLTVTDDHARSESAVECAFLKDAEKAHQAIMLAKKLAQQGAAAPAAQAATR